MNPNYRPKRINLISALQRHYKKMLLGAGITLVLLGPIAVLTEKKTYTTATELRIDPVVSSMVPGFENQSNGFSSFYPEFVATQKFKILKKSNLEAAIAQLTQAQRESLLPKGEVNDSTLGALTSRVSINPNRESLILSLVITGNRPEGLAEFLNGLVKAYLEELRTEKISRESSRIEFSARQRGELLAKISVYEEQIRRISQEVSTGNFNMEDTPFKTELRIQSETTIRAENDRVLKEKQYNEFVAQMEALTPVGVEKLTDEKLKDDSLYAEQRRQLTTRIAEYADQFSSLTAENQLRVEVGTLLQNTRAQLTQLENAAKQNYKQIAEKEIKTNLESRRLELLRELTVSREYEDAVKRSFNSIQSKYSSISKKLLDAQGLQSDLANFKVQLARLDSSLNYFEGEQQGAGQVTVENLAKPPIGPDKAGIPKSLILVLALAFGWVFFAAAVFELLDNRIKSTEELRSYTGIKPSWPISQFSGDFLRISLQEPHSTVNRALNSLGTRINQERTNYGSKVVCFSGVDSQCGLTEIALNCAHHMTNNCDKILLMDISKSRDGLVKKLNIPLENQLDLKNFKEGMKKVPIYHDSERNVDILVLSNPEVLDNKTLDRILVLVKEKYDIIFIDAPPVLTSPESEHAFIKADVVVLVVHGNRTTFADLKHTIELAQKFGISSAALVLNWWKSKGVSQGFKRILAEEK